MLPGGYVFFPLMEKGQEEKDLGSSFPSCRRSALYWNAGLAQENLLPEAMSKMSTWNPIPFVKVSCNES